MRSTPAAPGLYLRSLLNRGTPALLLEAHNAVSAVIASEAGADAVWVSSLTLSCSFGYADDESLPLGKAIEMLEGVVSSSSVPVLVDGDTGSCGARSVEAMVPALCRIGVAGVAFEDKLVPKCNSLRPGGQHLLAPVDEFASRLRRAKLAQTCPDFVLVARTEALIAGRSIDEAVDRAERYVAAGADAVLIHSKAPTFDEVAQFLRAWTGVAPVLCVPTTYAATPADTFAHSGIAGVIWANHLMRAAVDAMERAAREIVRTRTAMGLDAGLAPLARLWDVPSPRVRADVCEARAVSAARARR